MWYNTGRQIPMFLILIHKGAISENILKIFSLLISIKNNKDHYKSFAYFSLLKSSTIFLKIFKRSLNIFGLFISISERLYKDLLYLWQCETPSKGEERGRVGFSNNLKKRVDRENFPHCKRAKLILCSILFGTKEQIFANWTIKQEGRHNLTVCVLNILTKVSSLPHAITINLVKKEI